MASLRSALVATIIVSAAQSFAQGLMDPAAIQLKERGDRAIEAGHGEAALRFYSNALSIEPTAALHYNRGRALQILGRNAEALDEFEQFQADSSGELKAAVPDLEAMIGQLRLQVAEVTVECNVIGASVKFGGKVLALPLRRPLRFDPNNIDFEVAATGYEPWRTRVTVSGGESKQLTARLTRQDDRGTLAIASQVSGALVSVDGEMVGSVPVEIRLSSGEHSVTLSHPDFRTATSLLVLRPSERRSLTLGLERSPRFYERWWFWTGVGVAVTTSVVVGIAMSTERAAARGDIAPGQITSPLLIR